MCDYIVENVEELIEIVSKSNGKIWVDVLVIEVLFCIFVCDWYGKYVEKVL